MKNQTAVMCHNIAKYNREHQQPDLTPLEAAEITSYENWANRLAILAIPEPCSKDRDALLAAASILRKIAAGKYKQVVHAHLIPEYIYEEEDVKDYFGNFLYTRKNKRLLGYRCSHCKAFCSQDQNYCKDCGALMDKSDMGILQDGKDGSL